MFDTGPGRGNPSDGLPPIVAVVMGSQSDWSVMRLAADTLDELGISYDARILSAHRTPSAMAEFAQASEAAGIEVIIAGAGGAAHLPGMVAAHTLVPVLGVPMPSRALNGVDSLLSIVQMPRGVPVGTLAIGEAGAVNAALLAASIVSIIRPDLRERLRAWRWAQTEAVMANSDPRTQ